MTTTPRHTSPARERQLAHVEARQQRHERLKLLRWWVGVLAAIAAATLVAYGLMTSAPTESSAAATAPAFTLPTTDGGTVSLADYRGRPVILYFNEGAGCGACTAQMAEIEKDAAFAKAGFAVLPIVMNTAEQIIPDLQRYGVSSPYLLDDGTVSKAYGVLGTGMHADLPGHSFVVIDKDGVTKWSGSYPSMWLAPQELLAQAQRAL